MKTSIFFLLLQHDWDTFLHSIDKTLEGEGRESVQLGQTGPIDVEIVDARTSHKTSLRNFLNGKDKIVLVLLRHFA